ncbi:MAG: hypothetical protein V5A57_00100 [Candidatus Paceibacterota bacterium]
MPELFVSLSIAVFIGLIYWYYSNGYFYGGILLYLWCWLGPDFPKLFVSNGHLVNLVGWCFVIAILLLLLGNFLVKPIFKEKHSNFVVFLEIGLALHLMIDFFFNVA